MGLGFLWMLLLLGGTVVLALWLVKALFPQSGARPTTPGSEEGREASAAMRREFGEANGGGEA